MEGWNGGRGSSWSGYRRDTVGSNVSSPGSGTIASTLSSAYVSSGSPFSIFSMDAAMHFDSLGIHGDVNGNNMDDWEEAEEEKTEERIRSLVEEFFSAPSAKCLIKRGNISVMERWLTELGIGWVLSLDDGSSCAVEEEELDWDARTWIQAFHQIEENIRSTRPFFPDRRSLPSICVEQGEHVGGRCIVDRYHLALFIQESIEKMLTFIDVVVAWDPNTTQEFLTMDRVMQLPLNKLSILLGVHKALSSYKIQELFDEATSVGVRRIESAMANLLSAYKNKVGEAMWSTMEKIRTMLLEDGGSSSSPNTQESSDIYNVTWSVMTFIRLLRANYSSADSTILGKYVPHIGKIQPLDYMTIELVSCLEGKLANISQSISDQGLRSLFLLNNSYFIHDQRNEHFCFYYPSLNNQIKANMERYLQVSWAPLLACLFNPTPLRLGKSYSPLSKFESEFQKIYTTQKQWKVPNPKLKRRLRKAITDKIIPGYTQYIEDNKVTHPKISPQELEAMLQELFEG